MTQIEDNTTSKWTTRGQFYSFKNKTAVHGSNL